MAYEAPRQIVIQAEALDIETLSGINASGSITKTSQCLSPIGGLYRKRFPYCGWNDFIDYSRRVRIPSLQVFGQTEPRPAFQDGRVSLEVLNPFMVQDYSGAVAGKAVQRSSIDKTLLRHVRDTLVHPLIRDTSQLP